MVVQGPLADSGFLRDLVHADRSNALAIEQAVHSVQDPLSRSFFAGEPSQGGNQFSRCRAGRVGSATHARRKTPAILARDISLSATAGNFGKCSSWKLSVTNGSIENPRYSPDAESAAGSPTRAVRVAMPLELPVCQ